MINDKKIYEFCKDHYYCDADDEDGVRFLWEPFENHSVDMVEEFILTDVSALKSFLKRELNKEWDDTQNI